MAGRIPGWVIVITAVVLVTALLLIVLRIRR